MYMEDGNERRMEKRRLGRQAGSLRDQVKDKEGLIQVTISTDGQENWKLFKRHKMWTERDLVTSLQVEGEAQGGMCYFLTSDGGNSVGSAIVNWEGNGRSGAVTKAWTLSGTCGIRCAYRTSTEKPMAPTPVLLPGKSHDGGAW